MLRMFWACTHVTLRNVELPILIKAGFEIIPEEVNIHVVSRIEALSYDDPELDINKLWRKKTDLPDFVLNALRRARFSERNGLVSKQEQDLFNRYIDIIYVPTFLETAINAKKWFKGEVIFRYFGKFANLSSLSELALTYNKKDLSKIYCLPIFATLEEHGISDIFDRWSVLHSSVNAQNVPPRWKGVQPNQSAVVVLSNVHFGEQMEIIRSLIPLSQRIPILILGKNRPELIPPDILDSFEVAGTLDREEYFNQFSRARFVIYPNDSSYHMHYIPLEAIGAGIPLLCRKSIPLTTEYFRSNPSVDSILGVTNSHDDLIKIAENLYLNTEKLAAVVKAQEPLLSTFSEELILEEAIKLRMSIARSKDIASSLHNLANLLRRFFSGNKYNVAKRCFLGKVPNVNNIVSHDKFIRLGGKFPLIEIIPINDNIKFIFDENFAYIKLSSEKNYFREMLGELGSAFEGDIGHEITIYGSIQSRAALSLRAEMWIDEQIAEVWSGIMPGQPDGSTFSAILTFKHKKAAQLLLDVEQLGEDGSVLLHGIEHKLLGSEPIGSGWLAGVTTSNEHYPCELWRPEGMSALRAANWLGAVAVISPPGKPPIVGIGVDSSSPHVLRLADDARSIGGTVFCELELYAEETTLLRTVIECWGADGSVAQSRFECELVSGANLGIKIPLPDCDNRDVVPILFFEPVEGKNTLLTHARILDIGLNSVGRAGYCINN